MNGSEKGAGAIPEKWKFLIKAPFDVSEKCCYILKKHPCHEYERNTGEVPVIGTMAAESRARRTEYLRRNGCNVFAGKHVASYPLSIWTEADVWQYIKRYNIPICELYRDKQCQRTGCMFCGFGAHLDRGKRFEMLYRLHPALYRKMMAYKNNDVTYRQALRAIGVPLPDEVRQLYFF
jgi:3'-phosphoadenosine 5'-phosphosulfate sulfotransferase (PAPS reductase)/FAD synthetase